MNIIRNKVNHYTHWHFNKFILNEINQKDEVLEVGSGFGEYTFEIAKNIKSLTSIEIDKYKYNFQIEFRNMFEYENITIINKDFNKIDLNKKFDVILFCQSIGFFSNNTIKNSITNLLKKDGKVIILDLINNNIFNLNRNIMKKRRKGKNLIYYALKDAQYFLIKNIPDDKRDEFSILFNKYYKILKKLKYDDSFYDVYKYEIKNSNDIKYFESFFKIKKHIYFSNIFLIPLILISRYKSLYFISKLDKLFKIKFLSFKYVKILYRLL